MDEIADWDKTIENWRELHNDRLNTLLEGAEKMAQQHKPKLIEQTGSRIVTLFMLVTSWLSFVASLWLAMFLSGDYLFLGFFWLVTTLILAAVLGAKKKE